MMARQEWLDQEGSSVSTQLSRSQDGRDVTIRNAQDPAPFIRRNREEYNSHDGSSFRSAGGETFIKAFSLPPILVETFRVKHGLDVFNDAHRERIIQILSGSDYRDLQTRPGNFTNRSHRDMIVGQRNASLGRRRSKIVKMGKTTKQSWVTGV